LDEVAVPLIGEYKMAMTSNNPENMYDAFFLFFSLSNMGDLKDPVDWKNHSKTYDIYDSNRVQFYYMPKAFINNGEEVLLFKRRVHLLFNAKEHPNWELTPWTMENAAAPWVELRKMKIS
jgi:hypothetical protein